MAVESSGTSAGNPRIYELLGEPADEAEGSSFWAWPQVTEYLKVAGQPVQGPWPPHQNPRPDPDSEPEPVAVPDSQGPRTPSND